MQRSAPGLAVCACNGELSAAWALGDFTTSASVECHKAQAADLLALVDQVLASPFSSPLASPSGGLGAGTPAGWIACDAGPGAFTSLRLQASVAQSLAFGWTCPVVMVPSLERLAFEAWRNAKPRDARAIGQTLLVVAIDARLDQVYWQVLEAGEHRPRALAPAAVGDPSDLIAALEQAMEGRPGATIELVGEAFVRVNHLAQWSADQQLAAFVGIEPAALSALQWARHWGVDVASPPEHAQLLYVRDNVALTSVEQQALRARRLA